MTVLYCISIQYSIRFDQKHSKTVLWHTVKAGARVSGHEDNVPTAHHHGHGGVVAGGPSEEKYGLAPQADAHQGLPMVLLHVVHVPTQSVP